MKLGVAYVNILPVLPGLTYARERAIQHEISTISKRAAAYYAAYCRPAPWSRHRKQLIHNGRKP